MEPDYRIVTEDSEWLLCSSMYLPITIPAVRGRVEVRGYVEHFADFVLN